jgi:hypothetical protein
LYLWKFPALIARMAWIGVSQQVKISVDKNIKGTYSRYTSAIPSYSVIL